MKLTEAQEELMDYVNDAFFHPDYGDNYYYGS